MTEEQPNKIEERLIRIETAMAHMQQDLDGINQSLSRHFRSLQSFEERFTRIEHELEALHEEPEKRDPEAEKPPHY